jgi:hypothetical protein
MMMVMIMNGAEEDRYETDKINGIIATMPYHRWCSRSSISQLCMLVQRSSMYSVRSLSGDASIGYRQHVHNGELDGINGPSKRTYLSYSCIAYSVYRTPVDMLIKVMEQRLLNFHYCCRRK